MANAAAPKPTERFTVEQAGEYVKLATSIEHHRQDDLSYEQLVQVAGEVGVSEESLRAAIKQAERERLEQSSPNPGPWRSVADRCLEVLCLKPSNQPGSTTSA